jgi:hypothetical protein
MPDGVLWALGAFLVAVGTAIVLRPFLKHSVQSRNPSTLLPPKDGQKSSDLTKAAKQYLKAAEQGDAAAQYNLGIMYDHGRGVPQDYTKAAVWYQRAAEQGYAPAQFNLGVAYYDGQGVPKDDVIAAFWYRKAAEQGDATAQFNLGAVHFDRQGVEQDYAEAYFWLNLAALGKPEGIKVDELDKMKNEAASHLGDSVLAHAKERARAWLEEHNSVAVTSPGLSDGPPVGKFRKICLPPLHKRAYGQYRGSGSLVVEDRCIRISGKHVQSLGARWGIGICIAICSAVLTGGAVIVGFIPIYLLVEYVFLTREDLAVPWAAVRAFAVDPKRNCVAIAFNGPPFTSPIMYVSDEWNSIARSLRKRLPERDCTPHITL